MNSLPEGETPVYYVSTRAEKERDDHHSYVSTGYGYYVQAFYDFEIQGIANRFENASIETDDTTASLEQKGYRFNLGGSSDSYKVTAENRNDFENTVEKSYTYEKSTTTSTTVSNTYSQNWTEETTVGVEFSVPVLAALSPTAKVEQSFSYSYGMEKTYESSKEESYAQSITDTISVPLPAHTGIDINVDVTDLQTTIPYTGAVYIKYKTMLLSVTGYHRTKGSIDSWKGREFRQYTFGRNGRSAIEDLDARIQNRDVSGYDPDGLDMNTLYQAHSRRPPISCAPVSRSRRTSVRSTTPPRTPSSPRRRCIRSMRSIVWRLIPNRSRCTSSKACVWTASRLRRRMNTMWTGTVSIHA